MSSKKFTEEKLNLSEFGPDEWFRDRANSSFLLRIYASIGLPHDKFIDHLDGAIKQISLEKPVAIAYGVISGLKVMHFFSYGYSGPNGTPTNEVKIEESELQKSNYVVISTPNKIDGGDANATAANNRLNIVTSIIRAHIGFNFMRDMVFEAEVEADPKNSYHIPGEPYKVPQFPAEGPFLNEGNWQDIKDVISKLQSLQKEKQARIRLAIEFFQRGIEEKESFFYYWTALEILCNGLAPTIRAKIQKCYGLNKPHDVENETGFPQIRRWRHDFFHKGKRPILNADVERYVQLMFVDLLRQELGLPLSGHLAAIQSAVGYDLSDIGLTDNRTAKQKEQSRRP